MTYVHSQDRRGATLRQEKTVAYHSAESIAKALGGTRAGNGWLAKCPAHDDNTASLSIRDGYKKIIFKCHSSSDCSFADIQDRLVDMGLLPEPELGRRREAPHPPVKVGPSQEELRNLAIARQVYDQAFPCLQNTPCQKYLDSRGIWEPAQLTRMRYARLTHPDTKEQNVPCLVVPRHDTRTGAVVACQRVFLRASGEKYPGKKMSLGVAPDAWAMLITQQPLTSDELLLCEGPENALSAWVHYGHHSAWAKCGPFPSKIDLPDSIGSVRIVADNDKSRGSVTKAKALGRYIRSTGRQCRLAMPGEEGQDINDVVKAQMGLA